MAGFQSSGSFDDLNLIAKITQLRTPRIAKNVSEKSNMIATKGMVWRTELNNICAPDRVRNSFAPVRVRMYIKVVHTITGTDSTIDDI